VSVAPRLVLRVVHGAVAGTRFPIAGPTVVGRAPECTIAIADPSLSRTHFEVVPDGERWRITDLRSRNGTAVNGTRVLRAVVGPGDEIRAGEMTFRLEVPSARLSEIPDEGTVDERLAGDSLTTPIRLFPDVAPTLSAVASAPDEGTLLATLLSGLPSGPRRLYGLVDGAQAFELAFAGRLMGHELYTIFSGDLAATAAHVGPCLVVIDEPSGFLARWVKEIGTHAGVLFESAASLESVCAHLRANFVAAGEDGQEFFFRFYDPRVLRTFLPTCHEDELREFFGPIDRWIAENEGGSAFTVFSLEGAALAVSGLPAAVR